MARRSFLLVLAAVFTIVACDSARNSAGPLAPAGSGQASSGQATPEETAPGTASGPASTAAPSGEVRRAGSLTVTRAAHTATALPDGRLLITGGCTQQSCEAITATTELFDPATGLSAPGPDMGEPRVGHAAVLLPDDRVLLLGGFGPGEVLQTTELFDPATGTFSPGPDMTEPRADVAAFVLADGSVLVAAGFDGRASVATAELLDPAVTTFRATGSLAAARSSHAGALLADGRVFVAGGSAGGAAAEVLAGAEVYDPATGTWSTTGAMTVRRHKLAAVALQDGRVLVLGGSDERDGGGRYRSAELFDSATGTFTPSADMAAPRYKLIGAVVRLIDGRVLVAGGAPGAELFDPATATFSPVGGDATTDFSFSAGVLNGDGSVVITGGYDQSITLTDQVLRYVP